MLNNTKRYVVYLDPDTLQYMYLSYVHKRNYPVMNKLYSILHDGFVNDLVVTPLSMDHLHPYIEENKIDVNFLNMMGGLGQVQFLQRFTVKMLQLIRVVNHFFDQNYKKQIWKDCFSSDPDEKYSYGFNQYHSITAQNVIKALDREKKLSQIGDFVDSFQSGKHQESIAAEYFSLIWEEFPDFIQQYLPANGSPDFHMKKFFEFEGIKEIPEFHIISSILYPLFEAYGLDNIDYGKKDNILFSAETIAAYMPYCHFYVTAVDIAEIVVMKGINEIYTVKVYNHNESSLYRLIQDLSYAMKNREVSIKKEIGKSIFRKGGNQKKY